MHKLWAINPQPLEESDNGPLGGSQVPRQGRLPRHPLFSPPTVAVPASPLIIMMLAR